MLAEALSVVHADSPLWQTARPLVDAALRLEQSASDEAWHGWRKSEIEHFLRELPDHCALLVGVWEDDVADHETLHLACACEVQDGEVVSIRCLDAIEEPALPSLAQLEPGFQHAYEMMRAVKTQMAHVVWALFTDRSTWEAWLLTSQENASPLYKGELLAALAQQGRCVIMGNGQIK